MPTICATLIFISNVVYNRNCNWSLFKLGVHSDYICYVQHDCLTTYERYVNFVHKVTCKPDWAGFHCITIVYYMYYYVLWDMSPLVSNVTAIDGS